MAMHVFNENLIGGNEVTLERKARSTFGVFRKRAVFQHTVQTIEEEPKVLFS